MFWQPATSANGRTIASVNVSTFCFSMPVVFASVCGMLFVKMS
jgi:hypothetical protein